jgi:membrane glycosyltransferase
VKICTIILICLLSLFKAFATGISATTDGFYLVIAGEHQSSMGVETNEPIQVNDRLLWMPFCDTNGTNLSMLSAKYA